MESKRASTALRRAQSVLAIALLVTLPALANAGITVLIDGAAYPAQLRENTELLNRLNVARATRARHFEGELDRHRRFVDSSVEHPRSLAGRRLARRLSLRRLLRARRAAPPGELVLDAQSPKTLMTRARCASRRRTRDRLTRNKPDEPRFGVECRRATRELCRRLPDERSTACVCSPNSTSSSTCCFSSAIRRPIQDQAAALLNMVDGYYRNDMKHSVRRLVDELSGDRPVQHHARRKRLADGHHDEEKQRADSVHHEPASDPPRRHRSTTSIQTTVGTRQYRVRCVHRPATPAPRRSFRTTPR